MREIRTSGSVRDGGGDVPIYSAVGVPNRCEVTLEGVALLQVSHGAEKYQLTGGEGPLQSLDKKPPEQP